MKNYLRLILLLSFLSIFSIQKTFACHALALANINQQVVSPTSVFVNAASTSPTCGCGVYWLDVEVRCMNEPFDGAPFDPTTYLALSTYPYFQSATMLKPSCVLQNYPGVTIPFAGLCPGLTYQYRMRENNNGNAGPWSASQTFTVPGATLPLVASATASQTTICAGACVNLNSTVAQGCSLAATYTWDNGIGAVQNPTNVCPAATTTYCVTIVEQCSGFTDQACVTVNVVPPPVNGTAAVTPTTFCNTANPVLTIAGQSGTIQWQSAPSSGGPWTNIPGGTTDPFNPPTISATTCYRAEITGCGVAGPTILFSNIICVTLVVPTPPTMAFTNETCDGLNDGTATATPIAMTAPITYSWTPSGQNTQTATGLAPGTYTVTVTDANGCIETNTVTIGPGPLVVAGFTPPINQCLTGNSFNFNNTGSSGAGVSYNWNFGDANTSTLENPTHTYTTAGNYTVTQTVTNGPCVDVVTVNITVYDMPLPAATSTPVSCFGGNDGTGTVTMPIGPGPGPFSFQWDAATGSQTSNPATGLSAGNYTVTVTDQTTGCTGQVSVTVTQPAAALTTTEIHVDPTCPGANDGSATANPSGGTGPYTYSWNTVPAQVGQTAVGLADGTYTATVTDINGCITTINATVTEPAPIVLNPSMTQANCGQPDGSATVTVTSGGSGNFSYSWNTSPTQNTQTANNIPAGNYTVTVTDNITGCIVTANITVTTTAGISATATFINDVLCNGGFDGQASAAPTGGTGPYTYSWNTTPIQTTSTITAGAGTYTVVITDANGCTGSDVVTINEPTPLTLTVTNTVNASCAGANDGSGTVAGGGGTPGYTYQWDAATGNQTGPTATGLTAGTYGVTVVDANGCTDVSTFIVVLDGPLLTSSIIPTHVTCFGGNDGAANLTVSGGTAPYSYTWSPSGSTAEDPTGLTTGTHIVTVTSPNGCMVVDTIVITEPTQLAVTINPIIDVTCNGGNDGSATALGSGGTGPYTYAWNTTPVQNTATATNLPFGVFTVTVTDANGCTTTANANINQPPPVAATSGSFDAYCGLDQGTVWANPTTGAGSYTFAWDSAAVNIGNGDTLTNLYPGTYGLLITDANGCTFNTTVTVNPAPPGVASISGFTDVSCNGGNDGTATVSVGGAIAPYSYAWNTTPVTTTNPATGLAAGSYNVTVTDAVGCIMNTSVTITEPIPLTLSFAPLDNVCPDSCNASIVANTSGGTFPYSFLWNDPSAQITGIANNLCSGNYTVIVTDANGCTITNNTNVTEPPPMILGDVVTPANCNQPDGSATATVTANGIPPFTFIWDDGTNILSNNASLTNVVAGTYFVTATDSNGCSVIDTVTIPNLSGPVMVVDSIFDVLCFGGNNGYAEVMVSGGVFPYTYLWNDPSAQTTPSASNLTAGSYTVTATDSNGCSVSTAITINEPPIIALTVGGTDPTCFGFNDGSVWVNANGGVLPYTYLWNDPSAQANDTASTLTAGTYTVTVVDANGCFDTASVTLVDPLLFSVNVTGNNVQCFSACDGNAMANLTNGITPFTYAWDDPSLQTTDSIFGLCAATVNVIVTDAMGCIANGNIIITEPNLLVVNEDTHGDVSCNGGNDGFSSVLIVGGTGPYNYLWDLAGNPVSTGQAANNLVAGSYLVTVTDANGCTDNITVVITEPNPLTATATPTDAVCFGDNSGSAFVSAIGGTAPYSYQWTDAALQQTDTAFNLVAGSYDVTITDSLGCTFVITGVVINEPTQLVLNTTTVSSTCGNNNGSATVSVGGGTTPYSFSWNDPAAQSTATANSLLAGNYVITVTDANGCVDSTTANVIDLGSPTVTIPTTTDVSCNGAADGTATSAVVGGTAPYAYAWNTTPVQTTPVATGLSGQTYSVTVTDANGCTSSASATIIENSGLSAAIIASTNVSCNGVADGDATVLGAGGGAPYTYSWNTAPAQTTTTATGLIAGTYIVTISDTNACTASDTVTITEPAPLTVTLDSSSNVLCNAGNDGFLNVIGAGGTLGYAYAWTPNVSSGPTAAGITAGNYSVTITDANGCTVTDNYNITEPNQLVIDTVTSPTTCGQPNGTATVSIVTGSTPGYTYAWNDPNNQTTATAANLNASLYTVTVTDANGCAVTMNANVTDLPGPIIDSVTVTAVSCNGGNDGTATVNASGNAPFQYAWNDPFSQTNQTATGLSASPPLYTIVVTDVNGCTSLSVAQITEPSPLNVFINSPDTICAGESIQLFANANGGTLPYNFLWGNNQTGQGPITETPTTSTTYSVSVLDGSPAGCQASTTKTVIVRAPLVVNSAGTTICQGDVANLTATSTGGNANNPSQYFWMEIDSTTLALSPTGVANPANPLSVSPMVTTNYIVWVEDGCSENDTIGVTVIVNDTATAQLVPVKDTCVGIAQNFALTTDIGVSFGWDFDSDGTIDQTTTATTTSYTYSAAGVYDVTVTITTADGCVSTVTAVGLATVHPNPIADFTTDPNPPIVTLINPTFDFIDQSVGATTWNWNMGDLSFDTVQNPQHTYQDTGSYNVTLFVTNAFGCFDQINKTVVVKPDFFVVVPNTFTPNGNGLNEIFKPGALVGIDERNYSFFIFDRWGDLIFETHNLTDGWDGTANGGTLISQTGTYVWVLEVTDFDGNPHRYTGHVNLLK